ncbi:C5a anaphylatoxin chemotactic receptor 1-like isoform X2 [Hydra vulgaris]|uniref:C5a anaphylatoxin chemotactic receptor 1-like isoform X2 n=1 Tax=Hydra vulgaris TaxID=6087 RepID=A0ABM4B4Q3_HYDVU
MSVQTIPTNLTSIGKCELPFADSLLVVSYIAIIFIGVVGNGLVIAFFWGKLKKGVNLLIFYLAVFDELGCIIGPLVFLYWILTCSNRWDFGWLGCKTLPTFSRVITNISSGVILLMAIDRCHSIVFPINQRFPQKTIHASIFATVVISIIWEAFHIEGLHIDKNGTCVYNGLDNQHYAYLIVGMTSARTIVFLVIFSTTTTIMYKKIYNCKRMMFLKSSSSNTCKKNKSIKMLIIMAIAFELSVLPRDILHLSQAASWLPGCQKIVRTNFIKRLNEWFRLIQISNGIYNVFIYAKIHAKFSKNLSDLTISFMQIFFSRTRK